MAHRYLKSADGGRVAVGALKNSLFVGNARFALIDLDLDNFLPRRIAFLGRVTLFAGNDRHIRIFHRIDIAVLRDSQMTCCAVLFDMTDAVMIKFQRITFDDVFLRVGLRQRVTARAVAFTLRQVLKLIMTAKTRRVTIRRILKKRRCDGDIKLIRDRR